MGRINRRNIFKVVKIFGLALILGVGCIVGINFWWVNVSARFRPPCRYAMYRDIQRICSLLNIERQKCIGWETLQEEYYLDKLINDDELVSPEYRACWQQKQRRLTRCYIPHHLNEWLERMYSKIKGEPFYELDEECPGWNKINELPGRADWRMTPHFQCIPHEALFSIKQQLV